MVFAYMGTAILKPDAATQPDLDGFYWARAFELHGMHGMHGMYGMYGIHGVYGMPDSGWVGRRVVVCHMVRYVPLCWP